MLALVGLCWNSQSAGATPYLAGGRGGTLPADGASSPGPPPKRVALCFYGVTRSLRFTLPSIKSRLIDVISGGGMEVDVFVHTYDMVEYGNVRDGKGTFEYNSFRQDYKALNATR